MTGDLRAGAAPPLPAGFGVEFDADTKELRDGSLFGGSPGRVLKLTAAGRAALADLRAGPVVSAASGVLARRLTDAGLAHPVPPAGPAPPADITVVIPVRDRAAMLDRCLTALGPAVPVIVVDDGSADEIEIARIAKHHHADVRRTPGLGPAAARNAGLAGLTAGVIAFLDSDCVPPRGWLAALAAHLADPVVGAVAPRVVGLTGPSAASRYERACGSLDLGPRPARVQPGSRVGYVPTAALLVRAAALADVGPANAPFDEALRYGEDVDLIWRLHEAGWRIRYEPAVEVTHDGPGRFGPLLARRFRYGTSAAPLARRHPGRVPPLVLQPWPAITAVAALAGAPVLAAAGLAGGWADLTAAVRRAGVPADGAAAATLTGVRQTWLGLGRYATQFAAPALCAGLASRRTRLAAAALVLGPALTDYARRAPDLDPVRFTLARIADDVCYGAGVWAGCVAGRTAAPLRPVISRRPVPVSGPGRTATSTEGQLS